jgi:hypothetical protein
LAFDDAPPRTSHHRSKYPTSCAHQFPSSTTEVSPYYVVPFRPLFPLRHHRPFATDATWKGVANWRPPSDRYNLLQPCDTRACCPAKPVATQNADLWRTSYCARFVFRISSEATTAAVLRLVRSGARKRCTDTFSVTWCMVC